MSHAIVDEAKEKMDKSVLAYREELSQLRTGRASVGLLDAVDVEVYGSKMKLNQLGTVSAQDAHLLVVDLWDKSQIGVVEKAIRNAGLDLNPQNDGKVIRVPFPQLTEERRRDLVKVAGKHREEAKIAIRNVRRHAIEEIKREQKEGELPEDDAHRLSAEIEKVTEGHTADIDEAFKKKEADIMEV